MKCESKTHRERRDENREHENRVLRLGEVVENAASVRGAMPWVGGGNCRKRYETENGQRRESTDHSHLLLRVQLD